MTSEAHQNLLLLQLEFGGTHSYVHRTAAVVAVLFKTDEQTADITVCTYLEIIHIATCTVYVHVEFKLVARNSKQYYVDAFHALTVSKEYLLTHNFCLYSIDYYV